uniref:RNA helicase n=1 Tax=Steinernema glaseri TaxID=37863 RepID=A0A1I7ZTK7_9BILA
MNEKHQNSKEERPYHGARTISPSRDREEIAVASVRHRSISDSSDDDSIVFDPPRVPQLLTLKSPPLVSQPWNTKRESCEGSTLSMQQPNLGGKGTGLASPPLVPQPLNSKRECEGSALPVQQPNLRGKGTGMAASHHFSETNRIHQGERFSEIMEHNCLAIRGGDGSSDVCRTFQEAKLPPTLLKNLKNLGIVSPTPIQRATLSLITRKFMFDIIAQAETGSGKTAAYLLPIIAIIDKLKSNSARAFNSPYAIVLVPTRELACQVSNDASKFLKDMNVTVAAAYGQMDIKHARKDFRAGCDILVATPGRLLQFLGIGYLPPPYGLHVKLDNLKFTVVDEGDYFLSATSSEFETLIKKLMEISKRLYVFSATFDEYVVSQFRAYMNTEPFEVFGRDGTGTISFEWRLLQRQEKLNTLLGEIRMIREIEGGTLPKIVIFANTKSRCQFLAFFLASYDLNPLLLIGEATQSIRETQLNNFASGMQSILVCTDLAARGLNMRDIKYVLNYDFPSTSIDTFTHRVGRTGRNGNEGHAITFFEDGCDNASAYEIIKMMARMGKQAPEFLYRYAGKDPSTDLCPDDVMTQPLNTTAPLVINGSNMIYSDRPEPLAVNGSNMMRRIYC